jgi:lipoate-protein ligase A
MGEKTETSKKKSPPDKNQPILINYSHPCPYTNIALEEALFKFTIETLTPIIRIWENINPCIYLGIGNKYKQEVYISKAKKDKIPIIRRFSGGGTVFQAKGNLNYTFILPLEIYPEFKKISDSYNEIFKIIKKILPSYPNITFNGTSDFCINNKKFSGNAQARRKNTLLHHGTILYNMDLNLINKYLKHPNKKPEYRKNRKHIDFLTNLENRDRDHFLIKLESLITPKNSFSKSPPDKGDLGGSLEFNVSTLKFLYIELESNIDTISKKQSLSSFLSNAEKLVKEKYMLDKWNFKF